MLAARLPGNSTYDNPRYGQIRGCRGLPHPSRLTRKAGTLALLGGPDLYIQERQGKRR